MSAPWSKEELEYLEDKWGQISIPGIAKSLGRSINAVKIKAVKMGMGRHLHSGEEITFCQLVKVLGLFGGYSERLKRWQKNGFPMRYKKSVTRKYRVVGIDAFWKWAEQHKNLLDFSGFEKNMLGKEPEWVDAKRKADIQAARFKKTPWTKAEDDHLVVMLRQFRYGYKEISETLMRTEGAIKRRVLDLGIKERPVRADTGSKWTEAETQRVIELRNKGYGPEAIAEQLQTKSALAIRGKIERIDDPEIAKRSYRKMKYHFKQYFQKDSCEHWSRRYGCTANQTGCDDCSMYKRIGPAPTPIAEEVAYENRNSRRA